MNGYTRIPNAILQDPRVKRDNDTLAIVVYIFKNLRFRPKSVMFGGELITLQPGQMITSRRSIGSDTRISESKVERVLTWLKTGHHIEQRSDRQSRLITALYDFDGDTIGPPIEQRSDNARTTPGQRPDTQVNSVDGVNGVNGKKKGRKRSVFVKPSIDDLTKHFAAMGSTDSELQAELFWNYYESNGWKVGSNAMKCWKGAATGWIKRTFNNNDDTAAPCYKTGMAGDKR